MNDTVISIDELTKVYTIYKNESDRLKGFIFPWCKGINVKAIDSVSLTVQSGEIIGFIGLNGSGKSTLSGIISGITQPTSGDINIKGSVSMLSVNAGMMMKLSGRDNIYYKCLLLGFSKPQIRAIEDKIIAFADIGLYIDQPIRTYSTGMRSRLGFAISAHIDPDILVIDEALVVGDGSFMEKCILRMREFVETGKTIIFVSHSPKQMEGFCTRVIWLHKGKIVGIGDTLDMLMAYEMFSKEWTTLTGEERANIQPDFCAYLEIARASLF